MKKKIFLLFSFLWNSNLIAQTMSSFQAYDKVQDDRNKATKLWGKDSASESDIMKGVNILYADLHFLDSLPIYELAKGNTSLDWRKHDIYFDIAIAYALLKKNDSAFYYLDKMFAFGTVSSELSFFEKYSSQFTNLCSDKRFGEWKEKLINQRKLYSNSAFKTSYKPNLTEYEKIAGLSLLWQQARDNFVYFDHVDIDWNKSYIEYLPKVSKTKSTSEYYRVLQTFYTQLKDGHTNVYPPDYLSDEFYSRPPMRTELIEGRVFIKSVMSDSLKKLGITPGLEILKIDSKPVIEYADKYVKPYESSSTPQDMEIREFSYSLLCGPLKKPIILELKDMAGNIVTKTISRTGYQDIKGYSSVEYATIKDIAYLKINDFEDWKITTIFDSLFATISQTKGLIIDVRDNGGGSGDIGFHILKMLTDKPFSIPTSKRLKYISTPGEEVEWDVDRAEEVTPESKYYSKPVILLTGARTFSAGEDFSATFQYMKRGKIIGQPTGGSTGQPVGFDLPGGGHARVCGKRDTYPDGKSFVGIGIIPDIIVKPTIKDLLSGIDAVKDKAIDLLCNR